MRTSIPSTLLKIIAFVLCFSAQSTANAGTFPDQPIRIVVPFSPGGGTDFVSRLVGTKLAELTGWQVIIENRPGAGGNLAVDAVAKAPADGYMLVMAQPDNASLGPWLYSSVSYDTVKSFSPVIQVSITPEAIASSAKSTIKTPEDLVAKGKSSQGLKWSTAGAGTMGHLIGEDFKTRTQINLLQVPYKGASPALTDVMGGSVDVYIGTLASTVALVESGRLNLVAVATAKRSPRYPDVKTLDETVSKGVDFGVWMGLLAPVGTPPEVVALLNKEINRVLQLPDVISKMAETGVEPVGGSSADFAAFVKKDYERWGALAKTSGVKLD
ncbi:tripartite-type tricarboxylate transporter receptor subunit TctC [Jezberella montanilacus]|jgi:tripartite-type tricarboxylate transporter receptor subunit TctC|uniref:Tripartite-type tricarboxylate transporter receptor subunit TctC n=1 Tax=Jezberella montanilacus TaxID=323426 RepID=A0A2T0XBJ6_9BURK|nr:tripartite tricarboxylate transporter substrate binding protein [Jezberella montanilacus]PRY96301.1 tripartite-type tricarboxylate transporter receptor subunit TctC [Jezberella montanilacus]